MVIRITRVTRQTLLQKTDIFQPSTRSKPVSRPVLAIFDSLRNTTWKVTRKLTSRRPDYPSGTFTGVAIFTPHKAFEGKDRSLLYHETGEFKAAIGNGEEAFYKTYKKYIYNYAPGSGTISAWVVKSQNAVSKPLDAVTNAISNGNDRGPEDEVDSLLYKLHFRKYHGFWIATGKHLCGQDSYEAEYEFQLNYENELLAWALDYKVHGPEKDYVSYTDFLRQDQILDEGTMEGGKEAEKSFQLGSISVPASHVLDGERIDTAQAVEKA